MRAKDAIFCWTPTDAAIAVQEARGATKFKKGLPTAGKIKVIHVGELLPTDYDIVSSRTLDTAKLNGLHGHAHGSISDSLSAGMALTADFFLFTMVGGIDPKVAGEAMMEIEEWRTLCDLLNVDFSTMPAVQEPQSGADAEKIRHINRSKFVAGKIFYKHTSNLSLPTILKIVASLEQSIANAVNDSYVDGMTDQEWMIAAEVMMDHPMSGA